MKVKVNKSIKKYSIPQVDAAKTPYNRESIVHLEDSYEVLENVLTKSQFDNIPYSIRHFLRFFESFEPQTYYLINNERVTVADALNGDIFESDIPLQQFVNDTLIFASASVKADHGINN